MTIILALMLLLVPTGVNAQRTKLTYTAVQVGDTLTSVVGVNNNRNYLLLQNDSDTDIYCAAVTGPISGIIGFFGVGFFVTAFWPRGFWDMSAFSQVITAHQGMLVRKGGPDLVFDYKFTAGAISCIATAPNKTLLVTEGIQ